MSIHVYARMVSHATSTATSAHPPCFVISKTLFRWFFGSKIRKGLHHHQRREDQTYDGLPWTHPGRWPCKLGCWDVCSCCDGRNVSHQALGQGHWRELSIRQQRCRCVLPTTSAQVQSPKTKLLMDEVWNQVRFFLPFWELKTSFQR